MNANSNDERDDQLMAEFLDQYNKEVDDAEAQIDSGNYSTHDEVERLFADRRKKMNRD